MKNPEITQSHKDMVERQMQRLALRNPSWSIKQTDFKKLYPYLAVQKITFLQDDEIWELLQSTDFHETGKQEELLDALIIATNSQNAIRPQDLLSNDPIQKVLQRTMGSYGVGYERKADEDLPARLNHKSILSKEDAAAAYIGIIEGTPSKLRNSLSRREFFSRGDDYYRVFALIEPENDEKPEDAARRIGEETELDLVGRRRCLEILVAWLLREECGKRIAAETDKGKKGALRKATYFLGWLIRLGVEDKIEALLDKHEQHPPEPLAKGSIEQLAERACATWFDKAVKHFHHVRQAFIKQHGGNEDSTLKNTKFVELLADRWPI